MRRHKACLASVGEGIGGAIGGIGQGIGGIGQGIGGLLGGGLGQGGGGQGGTNGCTVGGSCGIKSHQPGADPVQNPNPEKAAQQDARALQKQAEEQEQINAAQPVNFTDGTNNIFGGGLQIRQPVNVQQSTNRNTR